MTDTPKLWRDMTREEKGALLLAYHEGKVIEKFNHVSETWQRLEKMWAFSPKDANALRTKAEM